MPFEHLIFGFVSDFDIRISDFTPEALNYFSPTSTRSVSSEIEVSGTNTIESI